MACARSAPEWPNLFYPENVFRVTLPRKSKFGELNWVLFHALRSLDWPLQRPRLLLQSSLLGSPPTASSGILSLSLSLSLSLARSLLEKRRGNVLAFSDGTSSVVRLTAVLFTLFLAGPPSLLSPFPLLPLAAPSLFLLIKIASRYDLQPSDAMRKSSRLRARPLQTKRPRLWCCIDTVFHGVSRNISFYLIAYGRSDPQGEGEGAPLLRRASGLPDWFPLFRGTGSRGGLLERQT